MINGISAGSAQEWFEKRRIGDVAADAARRWGGREALVFGERRWTYAELAAEVDRVAKGLMALGIRAGDHVGVWLVNRPEWVFLQYAIPRIGAVTVGLNTRYRVDDLQYIVDQSDCRMLIAADTAGPVDYRSMVDAVRSSLPKVDQLVMISDDPFEGAVSWQALCAGSVRIAEHELTARASSVDPDAPAVIFYTSGTTSLPKGAVHSHIGLRQFLERAKIFGHTASDAHLSYLPLFHAFGYVEASLMCGLTGAKQVLVETFDADVVLDLTEAEHGTVWHGFDTHWRDLLQAQAARPRRLNLRLGTLAAGMESSTAVARRAQDMFCTTVSGYGMSELLPFVATSHPSDTAEQRCEASGFPVTDIEMRIIDPETGDEQPASTAGEILVRGYSVTSGYYAKPDETSEAIDDAGWLHTGDMGRFRPDGHLVFMGRYKDMLKVGGENVSPAEIEGRLVELRGVAEAAVVGVPDDRLGEVAFAFVVREEGTALSEHDVVTALKGRIASFSFLAMCGSWTSYPRRHQERSARSSSGTRRARRSITPSPSGTACPTSKSWRTVVSAEMDRAVELYRPLREALERMASVGDLRTAYSAFVGQFPPRDDVVAERVVAGGVPGLWVRASEVTDDRTILYVHGGGYVVGGFETVGAVGHVELTSNIARAASASVLALDYRLAPEHPFPAAIDDVVAAYRWLLEEGTAPHRLAIAGESAGGGLVVAALLAIRDAGLPLPAAAVSISPWLDLSCSGETMTTLSAVDPVASREILLRMAALYLGDHDAKDPLASPIHGDLSGLPPILIQVGERETLLDDARRLAASARDAGVEVTIDVAEGATHSWHFFASFLPEARNAVTTLAAFIVERTTTQPSDGRNGAPERDPRDPDGLFAEAVSLANIPTLLMVLVQLTGDRVWLREPFRPTRGRGLSPNDTGGLSPAVQEVIRSAALDAILTMRNGCPVAIPEPSVSMLVDMLGCAMGEAIPESYGELIATQLGIGIDTPPTPQAPADFWVLVVGAGISGICMGVNLRRAGIPFLIVERADEFAGTWRANRYPGVGVDTPTHLYSFSFAPYDWSMFYAMRAELQDYLAHVVQENELRDSMRLGVEVRSAEYNADAQRWDVDVVGPHGIEVLKPNVVVSGVGIFGSPKWPDFPGLETFGGPVVHTATWPDDLDVTGQRVALVGNGASAMQVGPEIQNLVSSLTLFQRSPHWAAPFEQFRQPVPEALRLLFREVPLYRDWYRVRLSWTFNARAHATLQKDPKAGRIQSDL